MQDLNVPRIGLDVIILWYSLRIQACPKKWIHPDENRDVSTINPMNFLEGLLLLLFLVVQLEKVTFY